MPVYLQHRPTDQWAGLRGCGSGGARPPTSGCGLIIPEEGVFQIQKVTGFGARLVYLGHNTDVIALSAEKGGEDGHELAGETDPCLPQPQVAAHTFCWQ